MDLEGEPKHDDLMYEIILKDNQPNKRYQCLGYKTALEFIDKTKKLNHGNLPLSYSIEEKIASYLFCNFSCDRDRARSVLSDFSKKYAVYEISSDAIVKKLDLRYAARDADNEINRKRDDELWDSCVLLGSRISEKKHLKFSSQSLERSGEL